jgi:anti-anti-sigma factor
MNTSMLKPSVQVHNQDNILVAEFWDCLRLDPTPVQDLRAHYEAHLRRGGLPQLVVDLCGVGFAGSSSLGNFVGLHRLARQKGGRLIFCNVEPTVRDVFRASKLDSLFEFVTDREAAFRSIQHGPNSEESLGKPAEPPPADLTAANVSPPGEEHTGIGQFRRRRAGPGPSRP